jgi:hypothetical protein
MRTLSILLVVAGLGVGAATAYIAAGLAQEERGEPNQGEFASGPQAGSKLPGTFEPVLLNTADAGDECCVLCKFGNDPVAMVFAARTGPALAATIEGLEKAAAAAKGPAGACVVVTDTSEATKAELKKLAMVKSHVVLGVIDAAKLKRYALHPDAEVTVLLFSRQVVRANHAFKAGELTEKRAGEIADEAAKFLAAK